MTQVLLIPVKSNHEKLQKMVELAKSHFDRSESLTFYVEGQAAVDYIDKLLWTQPADSFLPHDGELITITDKIPKNAKSIFNLTSKPLIEKSSGVVYEFDDQSSTHKQEAFKMRYHAYKRSNFAIALL